jgi:glycosyltransferase involved in cell wall biosynthesis
MEALTLTYSLADQIFNRTKSIGIFNVSIQLLEHLAHCINITRLSVLSNSTLDSRLRSLPQVTVECYNEAIGNKFGRVLWDQWGVYNAANKKRNQWLFLPKGFTSFLRHPNFKLAVYVYDAIHDFYQVNYPSSMPWFENKYFTWSLKNTFKYANVIFTDTDFAKDELIRLARRFRLPPPLIITAGIGFIRSREMSPVTKNGSLLLLTSSWPHKITNRAVNFIERWQKETGFLGEVKLIGSLPSDIHLPHLSGWRHYQRLSETAYRQFLSEAKVLLFFSVYEGFGMPPVEAMIDGTCPVYSDLVVTREVMGGMGFSFSNDSYESFAQAMDKALNVSKAQIQLWADQLLERHNWDRVVERIIKGLV